MVLLKSVNTLRDSWHWFERAGILWMEEGLSLVINDPRGSDILGS